MASEGFELVDRKAAADTIRRMNEEDLRFLNRLIVDRLRLIGQARSMTMLARFSVGDRVGFPSTTGEQKSGVIVRLNKKTASIDTDDGQHWKVHPSFLTLAAGDTIEVPPSSQKLISGVEPSE
jgi:hypothetical protein